MSHVLVLCISWFSLSFWLWLCLWLVNSLLPWTIIISPLQASAVSCEVFTIRFPPVCMSFLMLFCLFSAGGHDVWVLSNQPGPGFIMGNHYMMLVLVCISNFHFVWLVDHSHIHALVLPPIGEYIFLASRHCLYDLHEPHPSSFLGTLASCSSSLSVYIIQFNSSFSGHLSDGPLHVSLLFTFTPLAHLCLCLLSPMHTCLPLLSCPCLLAYTHLCLPVHIHLHLTSDLSPSVSLAFRIEKCASKQPKNELSSRNIVQCISSTSFFLCAHTYFSVVQIHATCPPIPLSTVTCMHLPTPAFPPCLLAMCTCLHLLCLCLHMCMHLHLHVFTPIHLPPCTVVPAPACLPAWVSSLYFFFFMLVLTASPHCLHHCLALAILIP